jgi:hypothetical protein
LIAIIAQDKTIIHGESKEQVKCDFLPNKDTMIRDTPMEAQMIEVLGHQLVKLLTGIILSLHTTKK